MSFEIMAKKIKLKRKWLFDMDSQGRQQERSSRATQHCTSTQVARMSKDGSGPFFCPRVEFLGLRSYSDQVSGLSMV